MQQRDDEPLEKLYKPAEAWTALRISRRKSARKLESQSRLESHGEPVNGGIV
jgi:hypothetical protein